MTTIALGAYKGRLHLCADTMVNNGSMRCGYTRKIFPVGGGLVATAGDLGPAQEVLRWIRGGAKPKKKPVWDTEVDIEVLWVRSPNDIVIFDQGLLEMSGYLPYAAGSGGAFALSALTLGKSPREAVELACKLDCFSGGDIDELIL